MRPTSSTPRRDFLKKSALAGASLVTPWHQVVPKFSPV
ncbi:MAG: twin-arginine translocation signal domain-containing protein, partial [Pirellulaceae bacterium]